MDEEEYIECVDCGLEWPANDIIDGICPDCDQILMVIAEGQN